MIRSAWAAASAAVGLFCATPAHAVFASLALSSTTGEVIATHDATTRAQSERDALEACKSADCKIVFTTEAPWMALAVSRPNQWGAAGGGDRNATMIDAYRRCLKSSPTCHWRLWTQNSGDAATDQTSEFDPGPDNRPKLAAIGGAFSARVPNFKGFMQRHANLCWAAAVKTMYYAMSGLELSQWKLARLRVTKNRYGREAADQAAVPLSYTVGQCNQANPAKCEGGTPVGVLNYMGIVLPLSAYPKTTDSVAIWRSIRSSLQAGYPAIITIDWYTGQNHSLVVWGADFTARPESTTGEAMIKLNVYDPENDSYPVLISNTYLPAYEVVPGRFTGMTTFANYLNPASRNPNGAGQRVCVFLNSAEQPKARCRE